MEMNHTVSVYVTPKGDILYKKWSDLICLACGDRPEKRTFVDGHPDKLFLQCGCGYYWFLEIKKRAPAPTELS